MANNYLIDLSLDEVFGTGIQSIEQTTKSTEPGGVNIWTVTLTNGVTSELEVRNGADGGTPIPVLRSADMVDQSSVYLYLGSEEGLIYSHWYCYLDDVWTDCGTYAEKGQDGQPGSDGEDGQDGFSPIATVSKEGTTTTITVTDKNGTTTADVEDGVAPAAMIADAVADWADENITVSTGVVIDQSLLVAGAAADAKETGDRIATAMRGAGLTADVKEALLACFEHVAWIDEDGQDYYDALESALYPPANLVSISAVYTQSGTVYTNDSLDVLKNDLVVTALYDDQSSSTVTSYTLSGTLTVGTSTITVTYGGKTTTFTVNVTQADTSVYRWDLTNSLTDEKGGLVATTNGTQDANGLTFSTTNRYICFPAIYSRNRTYVIDVESIQKAQANTYGRLFVVDSDPNTGQGGSGFVTSGTKKGGDLFYINGAWNSNVIVNSATDSDGSYYNDSEVAFYVDSDGYVSIYKNGTLLGTSSTAMPTTLEGYNVYIGGNEGDNLYTAVFTGFRVYEGAIY